MWAAVYFPAAKSSAFRRWSFVYGRRHIGDFGYHMVALTTCKYVPPHGNHSPVRLISERNATTLATTIRELLFSYKTLAFIVRNRIINRRTIVRFISGFSGN